MNIVFISNYMTHHQRPLSDALFRLTEGNYRFIAVDTMSEERKALGYREDAPGYVLRGDGIAEVIRNADVLIAGSAPQKLLRSHIRAGKLLFRYSERPLKQGPEPHKYLPRLLRWNLRNPAGKPIYLLSASAYAPGDYQKFGLFPHRRYRFGYFPETKHYDMTTLFRDKDPRKILWAGRFHPCKHPEAAIRLARRLRNDGLDFTLELIGTGELEDALQGQIARYGLQNRVSLSGPMPPELVRRRMETAGIFLFTSDRREGWGAVVNEAMNSGCAVVASRAAGSVPYLISPGENGCVYPSGEEDALYQAVKHLLESPREQQRLGTAAYRTITELWNAEQAAARLVHLAQAILSGNSHPELYPEGPCSRIQERL